ncbi:MAG: hypothetical protein KJ574_03630 [Nanoarchaeota archaeon]|nr:hypothetical protein [Nanoarchaeota archaeon]
MNYDPNRSREEAKVKLLEDLTLAREGEPVQVYRIDIRNIVPMMAAFGEDHVDSLEERMLSTLEGLKHSLDLYEIYRPKGDVFYILAEGASDAAVIAQALKDATTISASDPDMSKARVYDPGTQTVMLLEDSVGQDEVVLHPDAVDTSVTWVESRVPKTVTAEYVSQLTDLLAIYNRMARKLAEPKGECTPIFGESVDNPKKRFAQLTETYGMPIDWDDVVHVRGKIALPPPLPKRETTGDDLLDAWLR